MRRLAPEEFSSLGGAHRFAGGPAGSNVAFVAVLAHTSVRNGRIASLTEGSWSQQMRWRALCSVPGECSPSGLPPEEIRGSWAPRFTLLAVSPDIMTLRCRDAHTDEQGEVHIYETMK